MRTFVSEAALERLIRDNADASGSLEAARCRPEVPAPIASQVVLEQPQPMLADGAELTDTSTHE